MKFLNAISLHLRMQRRRHRRLFITVVTLLLLGMFFLLYVWQGYAENELSPETGPDGGCRFLPPFLCHWKLALAPPEVDRSFDTLASPVRSAADRAGKSRDANGKDTAPKGQKENLHKLLSEVDKMKLEHIESLSKNGNMERLTMGHAFYKSIFEDLIKAKPQINDKLDRYRDGRCHSERYEDGKFDSLFSEKYLSSFLQLNDIEIDALSASHKYIKDRLPEKAPSGLYKGDGIVYVGGGKFNWFTLLSIRGLRGGGCELPVEILIPSLKEYDLELCKKVFPAMNAKCIHLPTALYGDDLEFASQLSFKGYQYKSLAILLSSFENVLLLDSDNMAAYSPTHLFKHEPFLSSGLIVWPDFWRRSTSPSFYKIAGEKISETELLPKYCEHFGYYKPQTISKKANWFSEVPYHERAGAIPDPSSESGQLMISKKSHLNAVVLALYYNTYGPKFYYPIFSQGAMGEGDKETFLAATVVLNKPYYQVGKFLSAMGNVKNGDFKGHGMGQFDPVEDYKKRLEKKALPASLKGEELQKAFDKIGDPRMLFLHANFPKLDPWALKEAGETVDEDGRHRLYGWNMRWRTGTDLEMDIWKHMKTILCEVGLAIDHFENITREALCTEISEQIKHLESTADKLE